MNRLRWTLILIALGVTVPTVLIVERAVSSLELENEIQHEAVAERVFDEMERALSDILLREESRPAVHYSLISTHDPASPGAHAKPLETVFARADEPFILGWFSRTPDGMTRILPRSPDATPRISTAMRHALQPPAPAVDRDAFAARDERLPAPGRTRTLGEKEESKKAVDESVEEAEQRTSAYGVLQSLNRAGADRSERQAKAMRKRAPTPAAAEIASAGATPEPQRLAEARLDRAMAALGYLDDGNDEALGEMGGLANGDATGERVAVNVDPMIGLSARGDSLVLARSVWRGDSVERQGLVLDRAVLTRWLEDRVLSTSALRNRSRLTFPEANAGARVTGEMERRYLHRFADPFADLIARLELAPLPGMRSARPIYTLAILLGLVTALGLFAVERMTRVVVDYAQRRSDFVAAVSHELKTPITSIRMYGEMLRDGLVTSDSKRAEYYSTITEESERLSRLIDNVLEFSRLEQNRRESNLVIGRLDSALRDATERLRPHVEREDFRLEIDIAATLPPVQYDRDALTQIVFNLVDNALKYARTASRREILINLSHEAEGVVLSVRDYGPGVPERELKRIFEPFYRVGEELTRTTEGTGIGLALVKELAGGMNASVIGRNLAGEGFEVCVTFSPSSSLSADPE